MAELRDVPPSTQQALRVLHNLYLKARWWWEYALEGSPGGLKEPPEVAQARELLELFHFDLSDPDEEVSSDHNTDD